MRRWVLAAVAAVVLLVHVSLLPALRPLGVVPNVALVFVVLVGLESTASTAVMLGVVMGLALELASGANLGMWTGLLVLAALVTGWLHRSGIETDGWLVPAVIIAAGTLVVPVIVLPGLMAVVAHWPVGLLAGRVVAELVLNLILMVGLRPVVRGLIVVGGSSHTAKLG